MATEITLTSKMGSFVFKSDVILSHAKLIRDCVTGQFFAPKPGERKLKTEEDIYAYVRNDLSNALQGMEFGVFINPIKVST